MASESPTSPQLSHGSCRLSEGRKTACPPDQRRPLRRVSDEEVSLAQHVDHDTAVDDRPSWRAADTGAAFERPVTQKRYIIIFLPFFGSDTTLVFHHRHRRRRHHKPKSRFRPIFRFIWEMIQDMAIVTTECE